MSVTAAEVAQALGLSQPTVSRALAGSPLVSETTRRRVEDAARRMGYRPNAAGRSLRAGRHGAIGVVVPDLGNAYGAAIAKGALDAVRERGDQLLVTDSSGTPDGELAAFETLATRADGILLVAPRTLDDQLTEALASYRPAVVVGRAVDGLDCVLADEAPAVGAVLDHLTELGHRRIGYQGGPVDVPSEILRTHALAAHLAVRPDVELVRLETLGTTPADGARAATEVVAKGLSAVIAFNDQCAVGLVGGLRVLGLAVPEQVSVVGWDDSPFARLFPPHLTTVHMAMDALAERAVARLYGLIADPTAAFTVEQVPTSLVVRASTARPPVG